MKNSIFAIFFMFMFLSLPFNVFAKGPSELLIDEFQTRSASKVNDEYVTITNYDTAPKNISGFCLYKKTASVGSKPELLYRFDSNTLSPGERVTLGGADYSGINYLKYNGPATLADVNNVIILYDNYYDKGGAIIDSVAYGTVTFPDIEGAALKNPSKAVPYKRTTIPENNDNSIDFEAYFPPIPFDQNADKVVISELLPAPDDGEEWFELFNQTSISVSLAGLKMCDAVGSVHCYFFSEAEILKPFEYKIYSQGITKITLNNTGDWLELRDMSDNLLADSGGNYGNADTGLSLSLFGSEFIWTKAATPNIQNIFVDTVEVEQNTLVTTKSTSKKVKTVVPRASSSGATLEDGSQTVAGASKTLAANNSSQKIEVEQDSINRLFAYTLFALAIMIFLSYNLWERRTDVRNIYNKIFRRNS